MSGFVTVSSKIKHTLEAKQVQDSSIARDGAKCSCCPSFATRLISASLLRSR